MKTTAIDRAAKFLMQTVHTASKTGIVKLPGIRVMAQRADVSPVTMMRAVERFGSEGKLVVLKKSGIYLAENMSEQKSEVPDNSRFEFIPVNRCRQATAVSRLRKALINGTYAAGSVLPTIKKLQAELGVGARSVRAILDLLCAEGLIAPWKRSYRVECAGGTMVHGAQIRFIFLGDTAGSWWNVIPRTQDFIRNLEHQAFRAGCRLEIMPLTESIDRGDDAAFGTFLRTTLGDRETVLGTIIEIAGITRYQALIEYLTRCKKPIAVVDSGGVFNAQAPVRHNFNVKRFALGYTDTAARKVASFLIERGHRHIAYICPCHAYPWSRARYDGLRRTMAESGCGGSVNAFTVNGYSSVFDFLNARIRYTSDQLVEFITDSIITETTTAAVSPDVQKRRITENPEATHALIGLFNAAHVQKDITAWVCSHDPVGFLALQFLKERKIPVPGRISVVSFDDTFGTVLSRLSSYNYNTAHLAAVMTGYVLRSRSVDQVFPTDPVEIDGYIIERNSSGPAPKLDLSGEPAG